MIKTFIFVKSHLKYIYSVWIIVGLSLVLSLLSLAQPEVLNQTIAVLLQKQEISALVPVIIFAIVSATLFISITWFKDIYIKKTKNKYGIALTNALLERLLSIRMKSLEKKQFGDISTTIIQNTEKYFENALDSIYLGSAGYSAIIITFAYMCVIQWEIAISVLLYNLIIRIFAIFVTKKIKHNSAETINALQRSGNFLSAVLRNMILVRLYSNKDFFRTTLSKNENLVKSRNWISFVWDNGFQDFIWAFSKLAEFVLVYGIGALLILNGRSNISILLTFFFANDLFTLGINDVSYSITLTAEAQVYQSSLEEILCNPEIEDGLHLPVQMPPFDITFNDVSFSYGEKEILKNVNFTIHKGEKILIKGLNGQGKTTILKLISGLYRPQEGKILFDSMDTGIINIDELTTLYGYITQHTSLLEGNVLQNLALSNNIDMSNANNILSNLHMLHCIDSNPDNLSMGEKQRLNIGRTLYRSSLPLLLCDEIFANLDKENRNNVMCLLNKQYKDSTMLIITHEEVEYRYDRALLVLDGSVQVLVE